MWGVQWRWRWRWRDEVFTFGTSSEVRADLEYYTYHCRSVALSDSLILGVLSHSRILTAFSQIVVFLSFSQILILSDSHSLRFSLCRKVVSDCCPLALSLAMQFVWKLAGFVLSNCILSPCFQTKLG
jgi:hypothetical protein